VFVVRMSRNPKDFREEEEEEGGEESEDEEFEVVDEREGRWSFEREQVVIENVVVKKHQPKVISPMAGTKLVCVSTFSSFSLYLTNSFFSRFLSILEKNRNVP